MIEERHFIYRLIKLQIQSITEAPVEVLRAGFRKDVKLMSIIPGKLKGQPHQLSFKFIRSANRLPMHPSSTLRPVVEHRRVEPLSLRYRLLGQVRNSRLFLFQSTAFFAHYASASLSPMANAPLGHCFSSAPRQYECRATNCAKYNSLL